MLFRKAATLLLASLSAAASLFAQTETHLTIPDANGQTELAIALSGDYLFVTYSGKFIPEPDEVLIFKRTDNTWTVEQVLTGNYLKNNLAAAENYLMIGKHILPGESLGFFTPGALSVYEHMGSSWQWIQDLPNPAPDQYSHLSGNGQSPSNAISISGNYAFVGAPFGIASMVTGIVARGPGAAFVYERVGTTWRLVEKVNASDEEILNLNEFGNAVMIHGNHAIVGADRARIAGTEIAGTAYIFEQIDGQWREIAKLTPPDTRAFPRFGYSVAIHGPYAIVGTATRGSEGAGGAAFIFERVGGQWQETAKLTPSSSTGSFGRSVAINDRYAVVGAPTDREAAFAAGAVYVYERDGSAWRFIHKLMSKQAAVDSQLGTSVVIEGSLIVATAPVGGDPDKPPPFSSVSIFDLTSTSTLLEDENLPSAFRLAPNSPNPFNSRTQITYAVPAPQHVRLTIYNLLGREVATLVDGIKPAGEHTVVFEAGTLPSGVYLYRMETDGAQAQTRKMLLLK